MKRIKGFILAFLSVLMVSTAVMTTAVLADESHSQERRIGDVLGDVLHTDIRTEIDGRQIPSFNIGGMTYIIAEDLRYFGFMVHWSNAERRLSVFLDAPAHRPAVTEMTVQAGLGGTVGSPAFQYVYTDIVAYIAGVRVNSFNALGSTIISIDDLSRILGLPQVWDGARRLVSVNTMTDPHHFEQELFRLINEERASHGLSPLTRDTELTTLARVRAENNMTTGGTLELRIGQHGEFAVSTLNPETFIRQALSLSPELNIFDPMVTSVGIGISLVFTDAGDRARFDAVVFFRTSDGRLPTSANPFSLVNLNALDRLPQSNIILPTYRVTTPAERAAWIAEYHANGGVNEFEMEVVRLVSEFRVSRGLSPVTFDPVLAMAARYYTQLIIHIGYTTAQRGVDGNTAHNQGPHGGSTATARSFGANITWGGNAFTPGRQTPESVVQGWIDSPAHFNYLIAPGHRYIGFGLSLNENNTPFQYLFLSPNASNR